MVYCLHAQLALSTRARRDTVLSDLVTRLEAKPRWGVTIALAQPVKAGPNGLKVVARFTSRLDMDELMARIESFATGQRTPLPGSFVALHDCGHDEETVCGPEVRRDW